MFIVVLFNVCLIPHMILILWMGSNPQRYQGLVNIPYEICLTMFFLNSILNPIVYAIRFQPFKVAFKLIFGCIKSEDRATAINEASLWISKPCGCRYIKSRLISEICRTYWGKQLFSQWAPLHPGVCKASRLCRKPNRWLCVKSAQAPDGEVSHCCQWYMLYIVHNTIHLNNRTLCHSE